MKSTTKPGKYGTLYLYELDYTCPLDAGFGIHPWQTYAYDSEHAEEKFMDGDEGFRIVDGPNRVRYSV